MLLQTATTGAGRDDSVKCGQCCSRRVQFGPESQRVLVSTIGLLCDVIFEAV